MRRRLRGHLPALAHWFGIQPWRVADLTPGELTVFIEALDEIRRENESRSS